MLSSAFRTALQGLDEPLTSTTNFRACSKSFLTEGKGRREEKPVAKDDEFWMSFG